MSVSSLRSLVQLTRLMSHNRLLNARASGARRTPPAMDYSPAQESLQQPTTRAPSKFANHTVSSERSKFVYAGYMQTWANWHAFRGGLKLISPARTCLYRDSDKANHPHFCGRAPPPVVNTIIAWFYIFARYPRWKSFENKKEKNKIYFYFFFFHLHTAHMRSKSWATPQDVIAMATTTGSRAENSYYCAPRPM